MPGLINCLWVMTVISASEIQLNYTPAIPLELFSEHDVTVRAQDANGASVEQSWDFMVQETY